MSLQNTIPLEINGRPVRMRYIHEKGDAFDLIMSKQFDGLWHVIEYTAEMPCITKKKLVTVLKRKAFTNGYTAQDVFISATVMDGIFFRWEYVEANDRVAHIQAVQDRRAERLLQNRISVSLSKRKNGSLTAPILST